MSSKSSHTRKSGTTGNQAQAIAQTAFAQGIGWHQRGQLAQAQSLYRKALSADPRHAPSLHHLGIIAYQTGNLSDALDLIDKALQVEPNDASAHNNKGLVYQDLGRLAEALSCFERALSLVPQYPDALNNRGNALGELKRAEESISCYQEALKINPRFPQAHKNLADALRLLGRRQEALTHYDQALAIDPGFVDALINRGNVLRELRQPRAALASYEQALSINPQSAQGQNNLGNLLQELRQPDKALSCFERATAFRPDYARAHLNRGVTELALARRDEAMRSLTRACELDPDMGEPRWARAIAEVGPFDLDGALTEPSDAGIHERFIHAIDELEHWIFPNHADGAFHDVGTHQPFYIAYRDINNVGPLSRYGDLCARVMAHWQQQRPGTIPRPGDRQKIRLGIVSNHIHDHSVWNAFLKGMVEQIDRERFELCVFSLGARRDAQTDLARSLAWSFVDDKWTLDEWVSAIGATDVDVLIYPEIGMDPMTTRLASLRLAPLQIAAWGHPETTGLPTIDFYMTATDFEPPDFASNYRERVIALPGLGCSYQRLEVDPVQINLESLGLSPSLPILLCAGVPFKYTPRFDRLLVGIAQELNESQFVFFESPDSRAIAQKTRARMKSAFEAAGLSFERHARVLQWQDRAAFHALMARANIYLDSVGFSGFNTAMQAIECGLPIVTNEGQFMRGRFASAILRKIGLNNLVTRTDSEYVRRVVELATNPQEQQRLRRLIAERRDALFDDHFAMSELQARLVALCKHGANFA